MIRNVNESLDEVINALNKMSSIYQSAEQISPAIKKFARMINESQAAGGKLLRLNGTKYGRGSVPAGRKRKRSRRAKRKRYL